MLALRGVTSKYALQSLRKIPLPTMSSFGVSFVAVDASVFSAVFFLGGVHDPWHASCLAFCVAGTAPLCCCFVARALLFAVVKKGDAYLSAPPDGFSGGVRSLSSPCPLVL